MESKKIIDQKKAAFKSNKQTYGSKTIEITEEELNVLHNDISFLEWLDTQIYMKYYYDEYLELKKRGAIE